MKNIIQNIQNKITKIKEENNNYNNLISNSQTIQNLTPIPNLNNEIIDYKIQQITTICPDINKDKAIIINKLIPLEETYLTVEYTKEVVTNNEYYIIPTNKYIWILNSTHYTIYNYPKTPICNIVKNVLMGKIINLNNIILEVTGNDKSINDFINIINNKEYRNNIIKEKTNYLCGITPTFQLINKIGSGISIDKNNNIVFHTNNNNYKHKKEDIINYELLFDNSIVYSKQLNSTTRITSSHNECYTMNIRITTKNNSFIIPILEHSSLNIKHNKQDATFQNNLKFANNILAKLKELTEQQY